MNRHGRVVDTEITRAAGFAERLTAVAMVDDLARPEGRRITPGADRAYDTRDFVSDLCDRCVTPHVAQNSSGRRSAIDGRTTRHAGYAASQRFRKRIEEVFGWAKAAAGQGKTRFRGRARVRLRLHVVGRRLQPHRLPRLLETG